MTASPDPRNSHRHEEDPTMSTDLAEAIAAVVKVFDSQAGSYPLTKNWIDEDDIRLAVQTAAPLIIAAERERIARAMHNCLTCGQPHELRQLHEPGARVERWTWAHPADGHTYRTAITTGHDREAAAAIARGQASAGGAETSGEEEQP